MNGEYHNEIKQRTWKNIGTDPVGYSPGITMYERYKNETKPCERTASYITNSSAKRHCTSVYICLSLTVTYSKSLPPLLYLIAPKMTRNSGSPKRPTHPAPGDFVRGFKEVEMWRRPLISIKCQDLECVELYLHTSYTKAWCLCVE